MEKIMSDSEKDRLYKIRHSVAHVMAQAVLERYPDARLAIGPPIDDGFYYDFDLGAEEDGKPRSFSPDDLEQIEKRMRQIVTDKHEFNCREISPDEARELFKNQPYKLELIEGLIKGGTDEYGSEVDETPALSTYRHDTFEDLCRRDPMSPIHVKFDPMHSSCSAWPAHIGEAMKTTRCFREFTAPHGIQRRN